MSNQYFKMGKHELDTYGKVQSIAYIYENNTLSYFLFLFKIRARAYFRGGKDKSIYIYKLML